MRKMMFISLVCLFALSTNLSVLGASLSQGTRNSFSTIFDLKASEYLAPPILRILPRPLVCSQKLARPVENAKRFPRGSPTLLLLLGAQLRRQLS